MQILAIGNRRPALRQAGFTLIEVLVAITIVGLLSAVVVLTMTLTHDPAEADAKRFMARMTLAAQGSILAGAPTGVALEPDGYRFFKYRRGGWKAFDSDAVLPPVQWEKGVTATLNNARSDLADVAAEKEQKQSVQPAIVFSPTGLVTPFALALKGHHSRYTISGDAFGALTMVVDANDQR